MVFPAFPFRPFSARLRDTLRRIIGNTAGTRPRTRLQHRSTPALVEQLESRVLLSAWDFYPDLVPTVGVYDENALQTNSVDTVAAGSSMTDVEFASQLATSWANNDGGIADGAGVSQVFGFGQDVEQGLYIDSMDSTGWTVGTPTDRQAISGTTAFATTFAPSYGGYHILTQQFGIESSNWNYQVLEFGLTVLGQTWEVHGTVHVIGHLNYGEDMDVTHQVLSGQPEDVFYGLKAPGGDFFTGFSVAYIPENGWVVDQPLWFDDLGFILGDRTLGNTPPTAVDDTYYLPENSTLTVNANWDDPGNGVLKNDLDPESHDLSASLVSGTSHGTLTWGFGGGFTYTPNADFTGTDSFTYKANDGISESNVATVTLTVTALPDPPIAFDDAYTLTANEALLVSSPGVMVNDQPPDGTWRASLISGPSFLNSFSFSSTGGFSYTPTADFHGVDSFTYRLSNGTMFSDVVTVTLTVAEPNDPPVATGDSYELEQNGSLTINSPGILANDSDANGNALTALLVAGPTNGTLILDENGSFVYTPHLNFAGTDSFTYRASDGTDLSNAVTVTLNVLLPNVAPVGVADEYALDENTILNVSGPGVLGNDSDPEGQLLTAQLITGPASGTLSLLADGSFSYTPTANFHGTDSFTYRAYDGEDYSDPITVTLNILSVNFAPVANNDAYTVGEDEVLTLPINTTTRLMMVSEPGDFVGQGLTYDLDSTDGTFTALRNFDNGVRIHYNGGLGDWWDLNFAAPGEVPLTVGVYIGATRFPFQEPDDPGLDISGQGRGSNTLTGEFTVHEVIYGPGGEVLIFDASFEQHSEGGDPALTGNIRFVAPSLGGVLVNDSDADGDPLSAILVNGPSHGTLNLNADGRLEYTPDANFHGTDSFTYQASDGTVLSAPATVTIAVSPVNDAPAANGQSASTSEDVSLAGSVTGGDIENDPLQFALVDGPANGSVVLNANGTFNYTPNANFHGSDSFTFVANDGTTSSGTATVLITVNAMNDAPTANGQSLSTLEDGPIPGSVTGGDLDGDSLQFTLVDGPANGSVVLNSAGTFTYTPNANFHGSDSFTFLANDGTVLSEIATVSITVTSVNDAPIANGQSVSTDEDLPLAGSVAGGDIDGDPLQFALIDGPTNGSVAFNSDGTFTYTPNANFHGTDSFTFTAHDGSANSDPATVSITINSVNDVPTANGQAGSVSEDQPLAGSVSGADVDGDSLEYMLINGPANGTLAFNSDGTFSYTPDANFHGSDSFTFLVNDGMASSEVATVSITVDSVNDAPTLSGATFVLAENSSVDTSVGSVAGSDVDGDSLNYQIVSGNSSGAFTIDSATGVIRVADSLPLDFEMTPEFTLTIQVADGGGLLATASVIVNLTDISETLILTIDVLPDDPSNTISTSGNGWTEVAIFSTADFDVHNLDLTTLRFGRTGLEDSLKWKKGSPEYRYEDVNDDGLLDVIVLFERDLMGFHAGDTESHLTGQTLDGTDAAGEDDVNLAGSWPS